MTVPQASLSLIEISKMTRAEVEAEQDNVEVSLRPRTAAFDRSGRRLEDSIKWSLCTARSIHVFCCYIQSTFEPMQRFASLELGIVQTHLAMTLILLSWIDMYILVPQDVDNDDSELSSVEDDGPDAEAGVFHSSFYHS